MNIEDLKQNIEHRNITDKLFIFQLNPNSEYLAWQYIDALANIFKLGVSVVDEFSVDTSDSWLSTRVFEVIKVQTLHEIKPISAFKSPCAVICDKVDKTIRKTHSDAIIELPSPQDWQIEEFVKVYCLGIDETVIKELIEFNDSDVFSIVQSVNKLVLFPGNEREYWYNEFKKSGNIVATSDKLIFKFIDALMKKDFDNSLKYYKEIKNGDCEIDPFGITTLLFKKIKDIIRVQMDASATPERLGMSSGMFWVLKNEYTNKYSREELVSLFKKVSSLDKLIKSGEIDAHIVPDYIITKIMGVWS